MVIWKITENYAITLNFVKKYGSLVTDTINVLDLRTYPDISLGLAITLKEPMVKNAIIVGTYLDFWWCYWPAKHFFKFVINFTVKPSIMFKIVLAVIIWKRAYYPANLKTFLYWWAKLALTRPNNDL
jgi:hypothetical protein